MKNTKLKVAALAVVVISSLAALAWIPDSRNFNPGQFDTNNFKISLKSAITDGSLVTNPPVEVFGPSNVTWRVDTAYNTNQLTMSGSGHAGANVAYILKLPIVGAPCWTNVAGTLGIVKLGGNITGQGTYTLTNTAGDEVTAYTGKTTQIDPLTQLPLECPGGTSKWFNNDGDLDLTTPDGTTCVTAGNFGTVNTVLTTNITVTVYRQDSIIDLLNDTHFGSMISQGSKGQIYPLAYVTNGEGCLRSIEFTSESINGQLDNRTNLAIRIYADAGAVNLAGQGVNLPAGNLVAEFPLGSIMCCKYWPWFRSNFLFSVQVGTRYVGWAEAPVVWDVTEPFANDHWTLTMRYPCPFTNGLVVVLWDYGLNHAYINGFSYAGIEIGTVPDFLRNFRLMTYRKNMVNLNVSGTNITILDHTGEGEITSIFVSVRNPKSDNRFWEGVWFQQTDYQAEKQFGCAGGEDLFNNGYYLNAGPKITWDWGARFIYKQTAAGTASGDDYIAEVYRHFYGSDSQRWFFREFMNFKIFSSANNIVWDSLCVFYGRPTPPITITQ